MGSQPPYKFVIVDDDASMLKLMCALLEDRGHDVVLSHSGMSAGLDIPDLRPDCVITDRVMFGVDGFEMVRDLREDSELQHVKYIMVSGAVDRTIQSKLEDADFDAAAFLGPPPYSVGSFCKLSNNTPNLFSKLENHVSISVSVNFLGESIFIIADPPSV